MSVERKLWLIGAALLVAVALLGPRLVRGPAFVERVSVVNPSPYDIHVEVSGDGRTGWMSLTTVGRASTGAALDVVDQGAVWRFRFEAQGRRGGELQVSRADLRQAGWSIEVPEAVVTRLRDAGAPPSP